jgi:hypothetical protein
LDELITFEESVGSILGGILVEGLYGIGCDTGIVDGKGDGFGGVGTVLAGRGMVGEQGNGNAVGIA